MTLQILGFQMVLCQRWACSTEATQMWRLRTGPCSLPEDPSITAYRMAVVVWLASLCMAPCQPQQTIPSSIARCSAMHHLDALQKNPKNILRSLSHPAEKQMTSTFDRFAITSTSSPERVMYACMCAEPCRAEEPTPAVLQDAAPQPPGERQVQGNGQAPLMLPAPEQPGQIMQPWPQHGYLAQGSACSQLLNMHYQTACHSDWSL